MTNEYRRVQISHFRVLVLMRMRKQSWRLKLLIVRHIIIARVQLTLLAQLTHITIPLSIWLAMRIHSSGRFAHPIYIYQG